MDCSALLKAQQQDFCDRLQTGNLLVSQQSNIYSENCILAEKVIEKINLESIIEAQNIVDNDLLDVQAQDIFNSLFYRSIAIEAFLFQFGDILWLDDCHTQDYTESHLTQALFSIKNDTNIKIILKFYQGDLENINLNLSREEINHNQIFVFSYFPEKIEDVSSCFNAIFLGFFTIDCLENKQEQQNINIRDLLYMGGLGFYLKNQIKVNNSLASLIKNHVKQGKYHQAIKLFDTIVRKGNSEEQHFLYRGICHAKLENKQLAISDFHQVIQLNHNNVLAYHWLGYLYYETNEYQQSLSNYNQEIKLNPLGFFAYFQRAVVNTKLNQLIDALEDYTTAIKINENFFQVYFNRAYLYYQLGDPQSAIEDYRQALQVKPNLYQAYYNLGLIYQNLSNYQEAINQYKLAIKINPKHIKSYYNLAIIQANLGLFKKAINHYKETLKIDPNFMEGNYNYQSLTSLLKNEGHILIDSANIMSSLEQTPGIISIEEQDIINVEDADQYSNLSIGKDNNNYELDEFTFYASG